MIYQKFVPEGWNEQKYKYTKEEITMALENNLVLQGKIDNLDRNHNAYVDMGDNLKGIITNDELGQITRENKYVQFKIKSIDSISNTYMLSRKAVKDESMQWAMSLNSGDIVDGIVRNIKPYGVFVDIGGGTSGLLYVNDISVARMKSPEEKLKIGQKIKVKIKSIDKENNRFYLSYKDMLGSWEDNVKEFKVGSIVTGIVKETAKNKDGIFIELKPNLIGMCEYREGINYGDEVNVKIKRIIPEKRKIKLAVV